MMNSEQFEKELLIGYVRANERRTMATLGDRSLYIGMSDVSKGFGCLRAAVASRVYPNRFYPTEHEVRLMSHEQIQKALDRIRPLERGHEQETGMASAFNALGRHCVQQLEIRVQHEEVPIHVHLDFTNLYDEWVEVVESKSNENIPDELYAEYTTQIYGQIGFIHSYWGESVFSVRAEDGSYVVENQPFAELAKQRFGLIYPLIRPTGIGISGRLLSMSGTERKVFGPYLPNHMMTQAILNKAVHIWRTAAKVQQGVLSLNEIEYVRGFHPLCDYCAHNSDCPKFCDSDHVTEFSGVVHQLKELQEEQKTIAARIDEVKKDLAVAYDGRGLDGRDYLAVDGWRFRNANRERKSLDKEKLKELLLAKGLEEDVILSILAESSTTTSFKQLDVYKVNPSTKKAA